MVNPDLQQVFPIVGGAEQSKNEPKPYDRFKKKMYGNLFSIFFRRNEENERSPYVKVAKISKKEMMEQIADILKKKGSNDG